MFKDRVKKCRTEEDCKKEFAELAKAIRQGDQALTDLLWDEAPPTLYEPGHKLSNSHSACSHRKSDSTKVQEKRICRCMRFYNGDRPKCQACTFPAKRTNGTSKFQLTEYEYPTLYNAPKLGGIDLIWEWGGQQYAVEVKPPNSDETLIRMVAEILTYTWHDSRYQPAICFFKYKWDEETFQSTQELSDQANEYLSYRSDPDFQTIIKMKHLHVFYITLDKERFYIRDEESEPLCE